MDPYMYHNVLRSDKAPELQKTTYICLKVINTPCDSTVTFSYL